MKETQIRLLGPDLGFLRTASMPSPKVEFNGVNPAYVRMSLVCSLGTGDKTEELLKAALD